MKTNLKRKVVVKKFSLGLLIFVIIILFAGWFFRPVFHSLLMSFYVSPLKVILIIAILTGILLFIKNFGKILVVQSGPQNYSLKSSKNISPATIVGFVGLMIVLGIALNFESEIRLLITAKKIDYIQKKDLPKFEPVRFIPKQVAKRYADDTFQNPQEYLGDSQIVMMDGKLKRIFPRLPEGGLLYFFNKLSGFVTVDVDTLDKKVAIEDQQFKYAEGIGVFDNLYYKLIQKKYFVQYSSEPIYLKNDSGEWVTVVPYIKYEGLLFRIPYWVGVMEIDSEGNITDYTPEEASNISYLKNNRIHPKELVNYYVESYSYKNGLLNKWFLHKNQIETVSLAGSEKIFHVSTSEGFKQIIVAEPFGRSYGIYKIFVFDATTGKREIVEFDQNSQLTGPVAAADYIKREFPTYSWDAFILAEPRPMKIGEDLHWLLSIIPSDAAGIAKTVLFNAKTNKVTGINTLEEFNTFSKTGILEESPKNIPSSQNGSLPKTDEIKTKIEEIQKQLDSLKELVK